MAIWSKESWYLKLILLICFVMNHRSLETASHYYFKQKQLYWKQKAIILISNLKYAFYFQKSILLISLNLIKTKSLHCFGQRRIFPFQMIFLWFELRFVCTFPWRLINSRSLSLFVHCQQISSCQNVTKQTFYFLQNNVLPDNQKKKLWVPFHRSFDNQLDFVYHLWWVRYVLSHFVLNFFLLIQGYTHCKRFGVKLVSNGLGIRIFENCWATTIYLYSVT